MHSSCAEIFQIQKFFYEDEFAESQMLDFWLKSSAPLLHNKKDLSNHILVSGIKRVCSAITRYRWAWKIILVNRATAMF